jgi:hypothetical protein
MACFAVPTAAAIIHKVLRSRVPSWRHNRNQRLLNYLFIGGSIFGIVDHAWNGELFMVSPNLVWDLSLGVAITAAIIFVWKLMVVFEAMADKRSADAKA